MYFYIKTISHLCVTVFYLCFHLYISVFLVLFEHCFIVFNQSITLFDMYFNYVYRVSVMYYCISSEYFIYILPVFHLYLNLCLTCTLFWWLLFRLSSASWCVFSNSEISLWCCDSFSASLSSKSWRLLSSASWNKTRDITVLVWWITSVCFMCSFKDRVST